ncbi:MAG TPA: hypothetical protein VI248_25075 [Kineosporiaceae bacterium]
MATAVGNDHATLLDRPPRAALEVDLATGPASSFAGLRRLIAALGEVGASFGDLADRYPTEWAHLTRPGDDTRAALADLALPASERRLHRESEQTFRVLSVAAAAVCRGSQDLGKPVVLRGVGCTDLASLRGVVRAREYAAATGVGRLSVPAADAVRVWRPLAEAADTREERARSLRALGIEVRPAGLQVMPGSAPTPADRAGDARLFAVVMDRSADPVERLGAALAYCRAAFYSTNWEGMAAVAAVTLPLAARLTPPELKRLVAAGSGPDARLGIEADDQAIEFEPALLRLPGDVRAYLQKILGIQASLRGRHDEALGWFRQMRRLTGSVSGELRAQSHLYAALTLTKRQHRIADAVAELEAGFDVARPRHGEPVSMRRERGWLHNLRGLTYFGAGGLLPALEQERQALTCVEGLTDPSSVHLRVNLVSNVSVLQETAGKPMQALRTWNRFRQEFPGADARFAKHHAYRAGALLVQAGEVDAGLGRVTESLHWCVRTADDFHEFEIRAELGTLALVRERRAEAVEHFAAASRAGSRLGDPYRMALAAVGSAAAAGGSTDVGTAACARHSTTQLDRAAALLAGCGAGADPVSLLPRLRTKLNRPFDMINI